MAEEQQQQQQQRRRQTIWSDMPERLRLACLTMKPVKKTERAGEGWRGREDAHCLRFSLPVCYEPGTIAGCFLPRTDQHEPSPPPPKRLAEMACPVQQRQTGADHSRTISRSSSLSFKSSIVALPPASPPRLSLPASRMPFSVTNRVFFFAG